MTLIAPVILIGLLGGMAVGLQGPLSSMISQRLGIIESVFIIHLGGSLVSFLLILSKGGGNLAEWRSVPWYALAGGVLGLAVISAISFTIPRVGVASSILVIVTGQLLVSAALDHFGLLGAAIRPLDLPRLAGFLIVFAGVWLVIRP